MRRSRAVLALFPTATMVLAATPSCTTRAAGEVVVVVTTDLAVPADIDTVKWTVTIDGQPTPLKSDAVSLDPQRLPATLSIVSGRETNGPIRVELEALHGGKGGVVRVRRRALLTVPTHGVKALPMPLNWLCSGDAGGPSCGDDQTCQGGACVASTIGDPQTLPDYVASDPGACFDARNCFSSASTVPAVPRFVGQQCAVIGTAAAISSGEENVMLVVNTSRIGNYGVCIPPNVGLCLIPLDRDSAEGWRFLTNDGGVSGIGLPASVCRDIGTTLIGAVVVPASDRCPAKPRGAALCTASDTCIASGGICPSDWGSAWQGYTCSGSASPAQLSSPPVACFVPAAGVDAGAEGGTATRGRWCCTVGETPAKDPLLIDDMSGGPQIKITPPKNQNAGFWYTSSDDSNAQFFPTPGTLFTYSSIAPSMSPDGGPLNAACFRSGGFTGLFALAGFNFVAPKGTLTPGGASFAVSAYTGIRFWAYSPQAGQSINVNFPDQNTVASDPGSSCNRNPNLGTCGDDWAVRSLTLTSAWSQYFIKWSDLRQAGFGAQFPAFDTQRVFDTVFLVPGASTNPVRPAFDFCVSQIYFTR